MGKKRFTETTKWTHNKWFRTLEPKYKLFWIYLYEQSDAVGVWEQDVEFASMVIGIDYNLEEVLQTFKDRLHIFEEGNKWWIKSFCEFQYKELTEESTSPTTKHYVDLLKKHRLWIDYRKAMDSPQEKKKERDLEGEKETESTEEKKEDSTTYSHDLETPYKSVSISREDIENLNSEFGEEDTTLVLKKMDSAKLKAGIEPTNSDFATVRDILEKGVRK